MNSLPHFICLGAHKSGTSWLYNCLYEHPEIEIKEKIDFFYVDKKYDKGLAWYADRFRSTSSEKKVGDLSTVYFFSEKSAERIKAFNPNLKLVVVLRNPIDRAYSHYLQDVKVGHISRKTDFETALSTMATIKEWGTYKTHLTAYLELFPKEQLKVILFDDIQLRPADVLEDLFSFLDINPQFQSKYLEKKINSARIPKSIMADAQLRKGSKLLKKSKTGEKLWWSLKHSWLLKKYYHLNSQDDTNLQPMNPKIREELFSYYYEDIKYIEELTGRKNLNWH